MRQSLAVLLLGAAGCGALTFLGKANSGSEIPTVVQQAFDESCASEDCHGSPFPPAALDLTAAASGSIIGRAASERPDLPLVEFGNLHGSYMALKLLPEERRDGFVIEGDRMPREGDQDSLNVAIILGWISGAELPVGTPTTTTIPTTDTGTTTNVVPAEVNDCSTWGAGQVVSNPVVYGEEAGMIPSTPGHIIEANCGCHTVGPDDLEEWVLPPPDNGFRVNTLADWQIEIFGVPAILSAAQRVEAFDMPQPLQCGVRSSGGALTQGDYEVLLAWLQAGAPDAPTWNAMRR